MIHPDDDPLLSTKEAARIMGIYPERLKKLAERGEVLSEQSGPRTLRRYRQSVVEGAARVLSDEQREFAREEEAIERLYREGWSMRRVASALGTSDYIVRATLTHRGVPIRPWGRPAEPPMGRP